MKVLVAHASKYGSTEEVAESIARVLRSRCVHADVRAAGEVEDIEGYDGVVLGGGIYVGRWHRSAQRFARHFADDLAALPVAVFALGPVDEVPEHRAGSEKQFRHALRKLRFTPFATALFGGAVDPQKLSFPFNHMPQADVRDWDAIRSWATEIADTFLPEPYPERGLSTANGSVTSSVSLLKR
jgi:menaquinone-dependent protoporphyrinogen oxidase